MKITYTFNRQTWVLSYRVTTGKWSGGHPGCADSLNQAFVETVGRFEYYPTPWHKVKHVADVMGGTVDAPEPKYRKAEKEGVVFSPMRHRESKRDGH